MNIKQENLKRMLKAKHIAFIGTYSIVKAGIKNCKNLGFTGEIYVVHQSRSEIEGIRCVKNISDLPVVPDAAFLAVRGERTIPILKELNALGTFGCVCYAAGFSEIGDVDLQHELIKAAGDMALIGPNCYGMVNFLDRIPLWPDRHGGENIDQGVAIISQSGNMSMNFTMTERSLPIAYAISIGNQAVLDIADYMEVLSEDPRVTAIGLHIEGLDNIESFMQAAKKAIEKDIPIVAFKTGTSELGSQLTMSHTSSLAGADDLYGAMFKRFNITRVDSLPAFLETLKLFSVAGSLTGRRLGVLTCSGGESTVIADLAAENNFILPKLTEFQEQELASLLTTFEHISNPLDYNTSVWGNETALEKCFTAFKQGPFDVSVLVLDLLEMNTGNIQPWQASFHAFIKVRKQLSLPAIAISVLPEGIPEYYRKQLIANGITPLQGVKEAFQALHAVITYNERKQQRHFGEHDTLTKLLSPNSPVEQDLAIIIDEWEGKQLLHTCGVQIPNGKLITSIDDKTSITEEMQAPFVVKRVSAQIAHKTDIGAVILNLQTEREVKEALQQMSKNVAFIHEYEEKYLVEEMIPNAVAELNIGLKRDEQFGLALIMSMGGEFVNLLNDSVPILLPTSRTEILDALHSLKGIKLLQGYRGRPQGDVEAVVHIAEAVATFAEANQHRLLEMDINPILVLPKGSGAVAVDAFIRTTSQIKMDNVHKQQEILY